MDSAVLHSKYMLTPLRCACPGSHSCQESCHSLGQLARHTARTQWHAGRRRDSVTIKVPPLNTRSHTNATLIYHYISAVGQHPYATVVCVHDNARVIVSWLVVMNGHLHCECELQGQCQRELFYHFKYRLKKKLPRKKSGFAEPPRTPIWSFSSSKARTHASRVTVPVAAARARCGQGKHNRHAARAYRHAARAYCLL